MTAHTDWSARNVRLSPDGVRAIYDLDSLAVVLLPAALGIAAATWRSFGEEGEGPAPGAAEVGEWLGDYPGPLTDEERAGVFAAALWSLVYTARCEHAVDPEERIHHRARPISARRGRPLPPPGLDPAACSAAAACHVWTDDASSAQGRDSACGRLYSPAIRHPDTGPTSRIPRPPKSAGGWSGTERTNEPYGPCPLGPVQS